MFTHFKSNRFAGVFTSPEPKAQVSLFDHNLSVVRRLCRCCCFNFFTFSSSYPEQLSKFQPNLAQSILGWREFNFVQMKGPALFSRGDNYEISKKHWDFFFLKPSSPEPLSQFQLNMARCILGWRGFKFLQVKNHSILIR